VFSEFLSAVQVARKPKLAEQMFRVYADEQPVVIQLYGKEPRDFEIAARLAQDQGAAGIDINMGCPAKKVVAHRHGSALMKEIDLACRIIAQVKNAVTVPVTVKTRLGWEDERNLIPFALKLQEVGLDAITVHGRTYRQRFEGTADWTPIYALKAALNIPVFGNGDIDSAPRALDWLGNLNGVMVGRAALADPWLMCRIRAVFGGGAEPDSDLPFLHKLPYWKSFAEMAVAGHSELHACRAFRKFLVRLVRELRLDTEVRARATRVETLQDIHDVLDLLAEQSQVCCD